MNVKCTDDGQNVRLLSIVISLELLLLESESGKYDISQWHILLFFTVAAVDDIITELRVFIARDTPYNYIHDNCSCGSCIQERKNSQIIQNSIIQQSS